jgi:hypothetical protein
VSALVPTSLFDGVATLKDMPGLASDPVAAAVAAAAADMAESSSDDARCYLFIVI